MRPFIHKTLHCSAVLLTRNRNDLDINDLYRDFTNNEVTYPVPKFQAWIASLHSNNQHYVPTIDSNIYVSNPDNESDAYPPWERVSGIVKYRS
jgi:alpha-glucosidase